MAEPVTFPSSSARFGLPLLFAGQAQKEFFVNEALAMIDALLHPAVLAELAEPPASPVVGDSYLVGPSPGGAWAERDEALAIWQGDQWFFVEPRDGMTIRDGQTNLIRVYAEGWQAAAALENPAGGTNIDSEARASIDAILATLRAHGILPQT